MSTVTETPANDNLDEIDKETLVSLLKDKSKELKQLSSKLNKLEEKYVKIFKENKNFTKDKESIEKFIRAVLPDEAEKVLPYESGSLDGGKLSNLHQERKEQYEMEKSAVMSEIKASKDDSERRNQELLVRIADIEKNNASLESELKSLQTRLSEQDKNTQKLSQEINELNNIVKVKNEEIAKYKAVEDEIASVKAESLIKELKAKSLMEVNSDLKSKLDQSNKTDQILQLKNELEEAHDTISRLEKENRDMQAIVEKKFAQTPDKKKQAVFNTGNTPKHDSQVQVDLIEEPSETDTYNETNGKGNGSIVLSKARRHSESVAHQSLQESLQSFGQFSNLESSILAGGVEDPNTPKNQQALNQQYLKNVVLKYFIYSVGENEREASILMSAICTILKMSKEERTMIENARRESIWAKTKSLFFDTLATKGNTGAQ